MKNFFFLIVLFFNLSCQALVAPEHYMADPTCPQNAPFKRAQWHNYEGRDGGYYTPYGECISCDTTKALMLTDSDECGLCANRTADTTDIFGGWITMHYCRLKECPPDKPFYEEKWNWSGCKSCLDEPSHIRKEECVQCPNMRWVKDLGCAPDKPNRIYYSGTALTADGREISLVGGSFPYILKCQDIPKRLSVETAIKTSAEECAKCSNTYMKDGWCHLKKGGE